MTSWQRSTLPPEFQLVLLAEVRERLDLGSEPLTKLASYRSDVYLYDQAGERTVVKLLHWRHRALREIEEELWWLFFLQSHGVSVSLPLPSPEGRLVETFDTAWGPCYAVRFEFARGIELRWEDITESTAETWGETMGRLHALSRAHRNCLPTRRPWIEEANYDLTSFGENYEVEQRAAASLIQEVMALPRTKENFGLIHADLHLGNLRLDGDRFIVFDADSSVYHWYLYDLAVVLHEISKFDDLDAAKQEFSEFFLQAALRGYRRQNSVEHLGAEPVRRLELFLELEQLGSIVLSLKNCGFPADIPDPNAHFERMAKALRSRTPPFRVPRSCWPGG